MPLLTINHISRSELFAQLEQTIEEQSQPNLMDSLVNIENKLDQLGQRMALLEEQLKS